MNNISYNVEKLNKYDYNQEIDIVIYSHTDFLDILNIQIDYSKNLGNLTLFINSNNLDLTELYKNFKNVVFYQDGLTYPQKMLMCLNQINYEYFIFVHDNDIIFNFDNNQISNLFGFLIENNYDRVDFQLAYDYNKTNKNEILDDSLYIIKSSNTDTRNNGYIYNVNPSIWKLETLKNILDKFKHLDYRTIEADEVQNYCLRFNIFKLYSNIQYNCGYFICLEPFKYLHITHSGHILSLRDIQPNMYKDIEEIYYKIVDKYNLRNSRKWIG